MTCPDCNSESCNPMWLYLCPICKGHGCDLCGDALVSGLIARDEDDAENGIRVCSDFGDSKIDALSSDTMASLIEAITIGRDNLIAENEANESI